MQIYISIIKYPLMGWIGYLVAIFLLNESFGHIEGIKKFCNYYFLFFLVLFIAVILVRCYRKNFNSQQTLVTTFLFLYLSSILVWGGYIYSETSTISTSSDLMLGLLSLFLYPLVFSAISSAVFVSIYFVIKKIK